MAGAFLSLGRMLPNRYPLAFDLEVYLRDEHGFGRMLDYAVIGSRLPPLYEWSARELGHPGLAGLICEGRPAYAWLSEEREVWKEPALPPFAVAMRFATSGGSSASARAPVNHPV
jgi:hypothetical protein